MRKLLVRVLVMAVVAGGLLGCGQSVEVARSSAVSRLEGMLFLDDPDEVRTRLADADSAEEVTKLIDTAEQENRERSDAYWSCADRAVTALVGSSWETNAWHPDGAWDTVRLRLEDGGVAALDRVASQPAAGLQVLRPSTPPEEVDAWLLENAEKVTGWSSDAVELIASRTLTDDQPPRFSPVNKTCEIRFNLTLTGPDLESQFTSTMSFTAVSAEQRDLTIDGKYLSGKSR